MNVNARPYMYGLPDVRSGQQSPQCSLQVQERRAHPPAVNEALDAADLSYDGDLNVRHACEVQVNDVTTPTTSPDETLHLIKKIVQAAVDADADVVATPCPLCQQNVEMYRGATKK